MLKRLADLSESEFSEFKNLQNNGNGCISELFGFILRILIQTISSARVGCINAVPCTEVFKLTMEYLLLTGSELANSKACYINNKKLSIVFFSLPSSQLDNACREALLQPVKFTKQSL